MKTTISQVRIRGFRRYKSPRRRIRLDELELRDELDNRVCCSTRWRSGDLERWLVLNIAADVSRMLSVCATSNNGKKQDSSACHIDGIDYIPSYTEYQQLKEEEFRIRGIRRYPPRKKENIDRSQQGYGHNQSIARRGMNYTDQSPRPQATHSLT